ncbi:hypothetical protein SAMN05421856_102429 [Chryseobacterium taichungense]|uniref:DNA-directed RNA polymerase n=1 Tax=Chryseobacterium taichungense TaxID=295069 RepID=A0A1H7XIN9_9FLAO|nr:hypothetical protein [Chryseobacterium taichungense]SEM32889.1 hypothetical protein SAMN05421856_102429 [Chryseobacterium taichungense]
MNKIKTKRGFEKRPARITKYISLPKFIVSKLENSILNNPPTFNFNNSLAFYFLNLIAIRRFINPNFDECFGGFVSLDSKLLEHYFYNYRKYFGYFTDNGILEKRIYSTNKNRANSFRFIYDSEIDCNEFVKIDVSNLRNLKNFELIEKHTGNDEKCTHLVKWFYEGLEIDSEQAILEAQKEPEFLKRQSYLLGIEKLKNNEYWFTRNKYSDNRLHTPLTNLSKKLRPFLKFDGEKLVNLDIRCSQPYFLVVLVERLYSTIDTLMFENVKNHLYLSGFKKEYSKIKNWILNEDFYTEISKVLFEGRKIALTRNEWVGRGKNREKKTVTYENERELTKKLILRLFYIDTNSHLYKHDSDLKIFDEKFPYFSAFLKELKKNNYKYLSKLMQNEEAHCILDVVTKKLSQLYPKMPLFTIHDSIMTTEYWAERTHLKELIQSMMLEANGVKPQINS